MAGTPDFTVGEAGGTPDASVGDEDFLTEAEAGALYLPQSDSRIDVDIASLPGVAYGLSVGNADTALTANLAYWVRVLIPRRFVPNRFGMYVAAQAGNLDVAVATDDGTGGNPGAGLLCHLGSFACPGTGRQLVTITPLQLTAGVYWLGVVADGTPATLTFGTTRSGRGVHKMRTKTSSFPIPDPPATNGNTDTAPLLWLERA